MLLPTTDNYSEGDEDRRVNAQNPQMGEERKVNNCLGWSSESALKNLARRAKSELSFNKGYVNKRPYVFHTGKLVL